MKGHNSAILSFLLRDDRLALTALDKRLHANLKPNHMQPLPCCCQAAGHGPTRSQANSPWLFGRMLSA